MINYMHISISVEEVKKNIFFRILFSFIGEKPTTSHENKKIHEVQGCQLYYSSIMSHIIHIVP